MVILKIGTDSVNEGEVEIVNEAGTWKSGSYHIFESAFLTDNGINPPEPHDVNSYKFLGEVIVDKDKAYWEYKGNKLDADEQKQVAKFILDYSAPDGVYW